MTKRDRELMVEGVLKRWRKLQEEVWTAEGCFLRQDQGLFMLSIYQVSNTAD